MRDARSLLRALIDAAEHAMARPLISVTDMAALYAELADASPMLPDPKGGLLIDCEAMLLAQVIWQCARQRELRDERRAVLLQRIVGVLLPDVRAAAWHAIEVERNTRATP